jgi:2-C-methyl-D-erythritol 4-phosphate cytidylyltransferase/2-C-methyl-D-erythritol 2,4-cyclodiphosphate synthase
VTPPARVGAVVPAAGRGERFGGTVPKALIPLRGRPLVRYSLDVLQGVSEIETIVVVVPAESVGTVQALARDGGLGKISAVVPGGQDRQASVAAGLSALPPGPHLVLVHDGARPFVSAALVRSVVTAAARDGGATAAIPVNETVKSADAGWVQATLDRSQLYRIQTPQAFDRTLLETAHQKAAQEGFRGTDDASLVERLGHRVRLVPGSPSNVKVTVPEDLLLVDALLHRGDSPPPAPRVGIGFDAHRFVSGRPLMLGGVDIPSPRGLAGHSDADVVVHAIMDALLGAAGCGDIGLHFPPGDPAFASARSLALLSQVRDMLASRGWRAAHVDVMVMAEFPRLTPHVPAMRAAIATALGVGGDHVNVKATTLEGMGAIGRREGIAAQAVASLEPLSTLALDGAR